MNNPIAPLSILTYTVPVAELANLTGRPLLVEADTVEREEGRFATRSGAIKTVDSWGRSEDGTWNESIVIEFWDPAIPNRTIPEGQETVIVHSLMFNAEGLA